MISTAKLRSASFGPLIAFTFCLATIQTVVYVCSNFFSSVKSPIKQCDKSNH